jgi:hypothetical protein
MLSVRDKVTYVLVKENGRAILENGQHCLLYEVGECLFILRNDTLEACEVGINDREVKGISHCLTFKEQERLKPLLSGRSLVFKGCLGHTLPYLYTGPSLFGASLQISAATAKPL